MSTENTPELAKLKAQAFDIAREKEKRLQELNAAMQRVLEQIAKLEADSG